MGNGITKNPCFSGEPYAAPVASDPIPDDSQGHSFTYVPSRAAFNLPPMAAATSSQLSFFSLSGASISANRATLASMPSFHVINQMTWPPSTACTFQSSRCFAAVPLQAASPPRISTSQPIQLTHGRLPETPGSTSTTSNPPFTSGPLAQSSSMGGRLQPSVAQLIAGRRAARSRLRDERPLRRFFVRTASKLGQPQESAEPPPNGSSSSDGDHRSPPNGIVEWAQGIAGEDRFHVAVSEDHTWVFIGIYDGFYGPDAADYLFAHLYVAVHGELKGVLSDDIQADGDSAEAKRRRTTTEVPMASNCSAPVHRDVLRAMARALKKTEDAFFAAAEEHADESPELGLLGSCVLVMVMKGADVYLMSVGDSRVVLARRPEPDLRNVLGKASQDLQQLKAEIMRELEAHDLDGRLQAVQLTAEHSTAVQEEVLRIKNQHLNDRNAIVNGRVKGKINVTRAFGVAYLKQPKWNDRLLGAFKIDYIGTEPYVTCVPSLCHHRIVVSQDKFLVLSSDGLYQFFTNKEVVDQVEAFAAVEPDGDPAQHLLGELLQRAAMKAGIEPRRLLDIPRGDRRRYHDDVSIIVISFKGRGRIWRSSV